MRNQTPTEPGTIPAEAVNAIVRDMDDPRYPSRIGVYCDRCGVTHTGEYMVSTEMSSNERLAVARKHLSEAEGWQCDDTGDFCPAHARSAQ